METSFFAISLTRLLQSIFILLTSYLQPQIRCCKQESVCTNQIQNYDVSQPDHILLQRIVFVKFTEQVFFFHLRLLLPEFPVNNIYKKEKIGYIFLNRRFLQNEKK